MTTIPMLEKELEQAYNDINYYKNRIEKLNNKLQQKENIIKEVRETLINSKEYKIAKEMNLTSKMSVLIELLEILEKENKEWIKND